MPDDFDTLRARLERARRRADESPPFSPDWDAAIAHIQDLERRIVDLERAPAAVAG